MTITERQLRSLRTCGDEPSLWRQFGCWIDRHRQRQDLAELDDHLLADIGVTREAAEHECAKPFWQR